MSTTDVAKFSHSLQITLWPSARHLGGTEGTGGVEMGGKG